MIEKTCEVCGKKFNVKNYRKETAKFCSKICSGYALYGKYLKDIDHSYLIGNKFRCGKLPTNKFNKGNIPWNKGQKGIHLSTETEFKKGASNPNKKPIGFTTIRKQKDKKRRWIKIGNPNQWELNAVYIWKKNYGDIPKGLVVHHKNKNSLDDRIENLELLTRAEHINIHRFNIAKDRLDQTDANGQMSLFLR